MRSNKRSGALLAAGAALAVGLLALVWAMETGSSEEQQGTLHNCPRPDKWAISVWPGVSGTATDQAVASCTEAMVAAAYWIDPQTQTWKRYLDGRPEISDLTTLDRMQGIITLGREQAQ
jgi:hypothetical protein